MKITPQQAETLIHEFAEALANIEIAEGPKQDDLFMERSKETEQEALALAKLDRIRDLFEKTRLPEWLENYVDGRGTVFGMLTLMHCVEEFAPEKEPAGFLDKLSRV